MTPDIYPEHRPLLTPPEGNSKLRRSADDYFICYSLSLQPGSAAICPHRTAGCVLPCVGNGGMVVAFPAISGARRLKTEFFLRQPERFYTRLEQEIRAAISRHTGGPRVLFRLNAFSDIPHEVTRPQILEIPGFCGYDYTKNPHRVSLPRYRLTFSRSEANGPDVIRWLIRGENVSVVFHQIGNHAGHGAYTQRLPKTWQGFPVVDGDQTDFRTLDPVAPPGEPGFVIGLRLKGTQRQREHAIETGFSVLSEP